MFEENKFIIKHDHYSPNGVVYGFLGKQFPISRHKYKSCIEAEGNKIAVAKAFGDQGYGVSVLDQVHGNKVIEINENSDLTKNPEGDAHVTCTPGILLSIQTADCGPVLFIDRVNKVIGAAHAGWRGAFAGIVEATIEKMTMLGGDVKDIDVVLGPCIQQKSYEVGAEFKEQFVTQSDSNEEFFISAGVSGKYKFDLPGYIESRLSKFPIKGFIKMDMNTFDKEELFFSYRRSTLRGDPMGGSILSIVGLE